MDPILAADDVRIDVAGAPAIDRLSLATRGDRVLVLGAARALFEAAAGLRPAVRGDLRVGGLAPLEAVRAGAAASAPLDPPLPPSWTVTQYATWSARLAGHARREAIERAREAIERAGLAPLARTKLAGAAVHVRRAAVLAGALATGAEVLLVEDPTEGLSPEAARSLARRIGEAAAGQRTAIFAPRVPLESPLALAADDAVVVDGSRVAAQGTPAELAASERTYALRLGGDAAAFAGALEAGGGRIEGPPDAPGAAGRRRLTVHLGPLLRPRDLLRMAAEHGAVVLELRPIGHAFA